jgi:hypothetical protein
MLGRAGSDWMEWQAGYASCAFLMPRSYLRERVQMIVIDGDEGLCDIHPKSKVGQGLKSDEWTKRDTETGRYLDGKKDGTPFKGVRKEK